MNSFSKRAHFLGVLFSVLYCTSFGFDWSNCHQIKLSLFTDEHKRSSGNSRVHSNFSHHGARSYTRESRGNNYSEYTKQGFEYDFSRLGYFELELLNQPCLYMHDAFVRYAQTYFGYKDTIQKLYVELKNINLIQKTYRAAKGTYCSGLQDRIAYLYKQLNTVKTTKSSSGSNIAKSEPAVFTEQFAEYKTLESTYVAYTLCLAKAINKRSAIYHNMEQVNKSYNLNNNIKQLLSRYEHELIPFIHCSGNQLQQVIHQESLDILDHIDALQHDSVLYDHQEALVDFAAVMVDYNHAGLTDKAMSIGDLCWTLLDYGQAIAEGAALGVYSAAHDILTNPIEATVSIIAGKQVLAFQLCKVLYNVADIGATAISDYDRAKEKWNKYAEPLNTIIAAINKKEITVRDAIKAGTAFVVGYKAQGKLLGGLGKFCRTIQQKSINFVKNSSLLNAQEYLTTPEGLLFKATTKSNKSAPSGKTGSASCLKKTLEDRISKKNSLSTVAVPGKGIICQGNLRAKIKEYEEHIFSEKHAQRGLMAIGENQEAIMNSLCETLLSLDKKGFLREGNNQLRIMLNGIDNIEVRCFIQKGEVIGINAFLSTFGRIFSNFVDTRNV